MSRCPSCGAEPGRGALFCPLCGSRLSVGAPERRKLATILFCDVVGSTALGERLEAETVREVMLRFFGVIRRTIIDHGGITQKFIGDAVMAVFGLPVTREDDAERALRAAMAIRHELDGLNVELATQFDVKLAVRIGINSGVVVAGDALTDEALALGDPVNTAARLEQAASPHEILLGQLTYELAGHLARVEEVPAIAAKGKAEPVRAYRLVEVIDGRRPLQTNTGMVGRARELAALHHELAAVRSTGSCRLIAITGDAGVGKSRLLEEFRRTVEGGNFLFGRCLSYGEGITYWPLVEIVKQLASIREGDTTAAALERLHRRFGDDVLWPRASGLLAQILGLAEGSATPEDIAWAARRAFDAVALDQPTVVCIDDLQWAEEGFLALIDTVAATSEAPILIVAIGRPELRDRRPSWSVLRLDPLSVEETRLLVDELGGLDADRRDVLVHKAGGNPLFVEELVAAVVADPALELPKTIEALLNARLDRLAATERAAVEPGAVEGEHFHSEAVTRLAPTVAPADLDRAFDSLLASDLLRPEAPVFGQSASFRFRNLLIRDAVYGGIRKRLRADLHEQFAEWLIEMAGERFAEWEEVVGYHLEQSYLLRCELGNLDAHAESVGTDAAARLASAGRRALARGDMRASSGLLRRATELLPHDPASRVELALELALPLRFAGDLTGADGVISAALDQAATLGQPRLELLCQVEQMSTSLYRTTTADTDAAIALAEAALVIFAEAQDFGGMAKAFSLVGHACWLRCRGEEMEAAFTSALRYFELAGTTYSPGWILRMLPVSYFHGPTPVPIAIERCEAILVTGRGDGVVEVSTRAKIAGLRAMNGEIERARSDLEVCRRIAAEIGLGATPPSTINYTAFVELLAGDLEAAESHLRGGCEILTAAGETSTYSTTVGLLARTLELKGALDEAARCTELSAAAAATDDLASQTLWRGVRARVLARRGEIDAALGLATEAVDVAAKTDFLVWRADALLDLAEVLGLAGDRGGAGRAASKALNLFETKGNVVLAAQARLVVAQQERGARGPR